MNTLLRSILLSIATLFPISLKDTPLFAKNRLHKSEITWQNLHFPKNFFWGAATSAFQIEGTQTANGQHIENNWTRYGNRLPQPGIASDHWSRFKEDTQLIKNAGFNIYRFSIDWSKITRAPGVYDQDAMNHYIELVDELLANNIEPMVCLWHYTWPTWFDDLGAFEKSKNIRHFVDFAKYVFSNLGHKVRFWMTFNQPVGYCFEGYVRGKYPPLKKVKLSRLFKDFKLCGKVTYNMLDAHVRVYHEFKHLRSDAHIGFCKVFQPMCPYNDYNPIERLICSQVNYLLHDIALEFFKTGSFNWFGYHKKNKHATHSLDWLGINYYTRNILKHSLPYSFKIGHKDNSLIMGSDREFYPEGLRWAIKKSASILPNTPLYITENGVNDPDDKWKDEFMLNHLAIVTQEIAAGQDIRGYFWWALMDTFSWKRGTDSKMGIYHVDEKTYERSLYNGVKNFVAFMKDKIN